MIWKMRVLGLPKLINATLRPFSTISISRVTVLYHYPVSYWMFDVCASTGTMRLRIVNVYQTIGCSTMVVCVLIHPRSLKMGRAGVAVTLRCGAAPIRLGSWTDLLS